MEYYCTKYKQINKAASYTLYWMVGNLIHYFHFVEINGVFNPIANTSRRLIDNAIEMIKIADKNKVVHDFSVKMA